MPVSSHSLLAQLRAATRTQHERLEERLATIDEAWTVRRYRSFLRMSFAVVAPTETSLCHHLGAVFAAPPPGDRAERLRADLASLGSAAAETAGKSPAFMATRADAFGAGYVLQGSLLGGAVIARQLRMDCGQRDVQTTYVELYGPGLSAAWKAFCDALNGFGDHADTQSRERAVAAAVATFDAYGAALDSL